MPTLNDVSQSKYDAAEAIVISLIRTAYPTLDLRRGTVLRDLLLRPDAAIYAFNSDQLNELLLRMSLVNLEANATTIDPEWINGILANFGMTLNTGSKASGQIMVRVDAVRVYTLAAGFQFSALNGLVYATTKGYTVRQNPDTDSGEIPLLTSADGTYYYFIIPIVATQTGAQYSILQETVLDAVTSLYGFVSAAAYSNFSGGVDSETVTEAIARIPVAVSYRALESRTSITSKLQTAFADTLSIQALGIQGYGDTAQIRDKHNPMGFAVGSRVDIYARTFTSPEIVTLQKTGVQVAPNTYQFTIGRLEAPGYYAIRSVSEIDATLTPGLALGTLPVLGSYPFVDLREADGVQNTFHDIDPDNGVVETMGSIYQKSTVTVSNVPYVTPTHVFKLELFVAPGILDLQNYVDSRDVRNLESDYLIRCPLLCLVGLRTKIYYDSVAPIDITQMQQDIANYVNAQSFKNQLTRSELASILRTDGATRVDLSDEGTMLQGYIRDAGGTIHRLQGDSLNIASVEVPNKLMTANTVVFAIELDNIHIEAQAE